MATRGKKGTSAKTKPADGPNHAVTAKEMSSFEKRNLILDLRENGASIRAISDHFATRGIAGGSVGNIHKHLVRALEDMLKNQRMKAKHIVQLELNKLDRVELAHFSRLLTSVEPDSIEKLSRALGVVWRRRDSLLGLNKPVKHEHTGEDGGPIETSIVTRVILPTAADNEPDEDEPDAG